MSQFTTRLRDRAFLPLFVFAFTLSACIAAPAQPTLEPGERPTPTAIGSPPTWTEAGVPVTLDNVRRLRHLGRLEAPAPPSTVFAYAISPDSTRFAALNNEFVVMWDLVSGETVFTTSRGGANHIFYSPDKAEINLLYPDGTLAFLDADTGSVKESLRAHEQFSGVSAYFEGWLALAGTDRAVKVWDTVERVSLVTFNLDQPADTLAFSPDGSQLAAAATDGSVSLWNWRERMPIKTLTAPVAQYARLVFSSDSRYLAANTRDAVVIWDTQSGQIASTIESEANAASSFMRFIPDTGMLVTGGSQVQIWQAGTGQAVVPLEGTSGDNTAIALSPDGTLAFTTAFNSGVKLWSFENLEAGTVGQGAFTLDNPNILDITWTPDGFLVLMIDARGPIEVWGVVEE